MTQESSESEGAPQLQLGSVTRADKPVEHGQKGMARKNYHFLPAEAFSLLGGMIKRSVSNSHF